MTKDRKTNTLFKIDQHVTYRKNGVCRVVDIVEQNFVGQGKKEYYVLQSVYDGNMKVFVPTESELEKEMQSVLSVDEINKIIRESEEVEDMWVDDCKARAKVFEGIINGGEKQKMLWLIKKVTLYKAEVEGQKKKMKANDLKYLAMAENIISGEFAFVLGLPKSEVITYIKNYLNR